MCLFPLLSVNIISSSLNQCLKQKYSWSCCSLCCGLCWCWCLLLLNMPVWNSEDFFSLAVGCILHHDDLAVGNGSFYLLYFRLHSWLLSCYNSNLKLLAPSTDFNSERDSSWRMHCLRLDSHVCSQSWPSLWNSDLPFHWSFIFNFCLSKTETDLPAARIFFPSCFPHPMRRLPFQNQHKLSSCGLPSSCLFLFETHQKE